MPRDSDGRVLCGKVAKLLLPRKKALWGNIIRVAEILCEILCALLLPVYYGAPGANGVLLDAMDMELAVVDLCHHELRRLS